MNSVPVENQQKPAKSEKPRMLKPLEGFLLSIAVLLLIFELFTTFNHNRFYSRVSSLEAKWSYASANHYSIDKLPAFQMKLAKLEAKQYGPFPASWFPKMDGLDSGLLQLEKATNKIWMALAAAKRVQALAALSHLKNTEGADAYPRLKGKYQSSLKKATEPQDYEKLTKTWTDLSKEWVSSQAKLKKVSGGMSNNHPADIVQAEQKLESLLKKTNNHQGLQDKTNKLLKQVHQYYEATPITQLKQHSTIMGKLDARAKQLQKELAPQKINVPLIKQLAGSGLYNGCEVTSLAMILQFAGFHVSKDELAKKIPKEPIKLDDGLHGNPNKGFVGDIDGSSPGYFVYHGPIANLAKKYAGKKVQDLTGSALSAIYEKLAEGIPVLVYTTTDFSPHQTLTWKTKQGDVKVSKFEHCVVLTGYSKKYVWVNNPYGTKNQKVNRSQFEKSWIEMGRQAIVINK